MKSGTLKDSATGYSALSIFLHWSAALIVIALFVLGEMAEGAPQEQRRELLGLHISIAMAAYLLLMARIIWRLCVPRPQNPQQAPLLMTLAHWVPLILLLAMTINLISGPIMVWTKGFAISVFGWFEIPSPFGEMETLHEAMETAHKLGAKALLLAFALHIAGVLKHALINKDGTLLRMLKPQKPE